LPASLVARTDFSTLELCSGSFVDETLIGSQSDLLFSVKVGSMPALLYVLFEHQSSVDKLTN
jgi:predicted transposase YdaD